MPPAPISDEAYRAAAAAAAVEGTGPELASGCKVVRTPYGGVQRVHDGAFVEVVVWIPEGVARAAQEALAPTPANEARPISG